MAEILSAWHLDPQALMAALLHDVMEDTGIVKEEIGDKFGRTTADLVDGVSKLDKIEFQSHQDAQAENFRKMLLAMARDLRVVLIKLADRLHNLRTLAVRATRQAAAHRQRNPRNLCRRSPTGWASTASFASCRICRSGTSIPLRYAVIDKSVRAARGHRREVVGKILESIKRRLPENGIDAEVFGREKHLYGIYRKMAQQHLSFSQVLDIYGFRVIVKDVPTCYLALGALHALYKPVPGKFKDYIAIPKANGYQSLHTTLIGPYGTPVEVQIRTAEMHHIAESGVASHWLYKEDDDAVAELQRKTHKWLQSLLELQNTAGDSAEFLEHVKIDLFPGEVYVFTPKGKIMAHAARFDGGRFCLRRAYRCRPPLRGLPHQPRTDALAHRTEERRSGRDHHRHTRQPECRPGCRMSRPARRARKIRHFLKNMQQQESSSLGEKLLDKALEEIGVKPGAIEAPAWERMMRDSGAKSKREILEDIGLGKRLAAVVARRLVLREDILPLDAKSGTSAVVIRGSEGVAVQFGKCCRPIPGDPIVGSIKKGQGLVVHTHDCHAIRKSRHSEPDKWIDVEWDAERGRLFEVRITVHAQNRRGVLAKVAAAISDAGSNIENVSMDDERGIYTSLFFNVQVSDRIHLARVMRSIRRIQEVVRINRVKTDA